MRALPLLSMLLAAGALAGCGEREQTLETGRKVDAKVWHNNHTAFLAPGWTPGDETKWREQILDRTKGQNEYTRAPASR